MINRRQLRGLVRDYVLDHLDATPGCSQEECQQAVSLKLREDFGDASEWLELLLRLLELLLPLLFTLRRGRGE